MPAVFEFRPDGKKLVVERTVDGKKERGLMPLPREEFKGLPKKFKNRHRECLNTIFEVGNHYAEKGREVPLTRGELMKVGFDKQVLKDLEHFGFIETYLIELGTGGRSMGGRIIVMITPQGKAVVKFFSDAVSEIENSSEAEKPADPQTAEPASLAQES